MQHTVTHGPSDCTAVLLSSLSHDRRHLTLSASHYQGTSEWSWGSRQHIVSRQHASRDEETPSEDGTLSKV